MENYINQLTVKQQLFCDEYLKDMNATRAALRAGYSAETAMNGALMRKPKIKTHIEHRLNTIKDQCPVTREMVIAELSRIAFGNMSNYYDADNKLKPMSQLSEDEKAALWQVKNNADGTLNLKMYNKLVAMEKLIKLMGFYEPEYEEPEPEYVYLDRDDIQEDDRFEDPLYDEEDTEDTDEEEIEFADEHGNAIYNEPIPYGPTADVFVFDMHDTEDETWNKLCLYSELPQIVVNDVNVCGDDILQGLNAWLVKELSACGCGINGDDMEQVVDKFVMLRRMRGKKVFEEVA